ncbi:MAG: hypothetical protein WBD09_07240 [Halobacteriota archaeon]
MVEGGIQAPLKTKTGTTLNKTKKGKVVVSWTGGKDGCFACYKAISEGFDVSYPLNFIERWILVLKYFKI